MAVFSSKLLLVISVALLPTMATPWRFRGGGGWQDEEGVAPSPTPSPTAASSDAQGTIQKLVQHRHSINRTVDETEDGVETYTWSEKEEVSAWIKQHVEDMIALMGSNGRMRQWDPLFVAVFDHKSDIHLDCTEQEDGKLGCNHTAQDDCAIDIIQTHAQVVSDFLTYGSEEVGLEHDAPSCA